MAVERDENELSIPDVLGILPLRGTVILPHAVIPLAVGRPGSVRLVQEALQGSRILGAVMQRDPAAEDPRAQDLHSIGTVILIHKALKQPDGTLRLVVQGLTRFRIGDVVQEAPFLRARIQRLTDETPATATLEVEALARTARSEEHTSELQSRENLVCRLLLEKKKKTRNNIIRTKKQPQTY